MNSSSFAIKISKEIRAYQEKIMLGLNFRQLVCTMLTLLICVPLYYFGREYINEDILSWLVILIGMPLLAMGFYPVQGMPFEKYVWAIIKTLYIYPKKRRYKSSNLFSELDREASRNEIRGISSKKLAKYDEEAGLEKAYLLEQAEKYGLNVDLDKLDDNLLTVSKPVSKKEKIKENGNMQKKVNVKQESLRKKVEEIKNKIEADKLYIPSKKENKIIKQYNDIVNKERIKEINIAKKGIKKKSTSMAKRRKAKTNVPKSTQDTVPFIADYDEGLFEVEVNKYSKSYELNDINYLDENDQEKEAIFEKWGEFLNYFGDDVSVQVSLDNRIVSRNEQEQKIFYKKQNSSLDIHRTEFNNVLKRQMRQMTKGANSIQKTRYIVITIHAGNPYEALLKFHRIDQEVQQAIRKISPNAKIRLMSTEERLEMLHDKLRRGKEGDFSVLLQDFEKQGMDFYQHLKSQGLSSKDYIAPSSFTFGQKDYFMIGDTYCRTMYLNNLPASLANDNFAKMIDVEFPMITSLSIQPVAKDKGLRLIKKKLTGIEKDKIEAEKEAIRNGYSPDSINHDIKESLAEAEEMYDFCVNRNQKIFFVTIGFLVMEDTYDKLDNACTQLINNARQFTCQINKFDYQQEDAFKVIMPMGISPKHKLYVDRTLTTESTALFSPFKCQELFQEGGFYYGLNQQSLNLILLDRTSMKTPSGFLLGSSGSGKSFSTKREILNVLLKDESTPIIVIDPENEYGGFCRLFSGSILNFSSSSDIHINPFDMDENYGLEEEDDPNEIPLNIKKDKALNKKVGYIMSVVSSMVSSETKPNIDAQEKSIIDKAVRRTYEEFLSKDFDMDYVPTFVTFQKELNKEILREDGSVNDKARNLAESCEYYTTGSMNLFSHKTNIDLSNRFITFNIRDLDKDLVQVSLLFILDFVWNSMIKNAHKKLRTYCYVDEIHVIFRNDLSANYLRDLYKRGRKYGLVITGITQDVEDLLKYEKARAMLSNSDFILMLNQKGDNLLLLKELLNISPSQLGYLNNADAGSGLLFAENTIVPFVDQFPSDSYLYKLMSTKFGENEVSDEDIKKHINKLLMEQKAQEEKAEDNAVNKTA